MRHRGQRGFTLVELLASLGIVSVMVTLVGAGVFQAITFSERANYRSLAQRETRNALHWTTRDIPMAQASIEVVDGAAPVYLVGGAPLVSSVTFTWKDVFADPDPPILHSLKYEVSGGRELVRTYDLGPTTIIGRSISSLSFSRTGRLITVTIIAQPVNRFQATDQKTLTVMMRGNG